MRFRHAIGDAELLGYGRVGIAEDGKRQMVLLQGEVVVAPGLRRDRDEKRSHAADLSVEIAPDFELGDAVGTPAAAEELDHQRTERKQVGRVDLLAGKRIGQRELRRLRASAKNAAFDAGSEEFRGLSFRDGQPLRLNQGARILRNAVEFVLQRWDRGPGHGFHTYIIAAMSAIAPCSPSLAVAASWHDTAATAAFAGVDPPPAGFCGGFALAALLLPSSETRRLKPSSQAFLFASL